jgi:murein DD-endopeptidase MepM/ murein hydrolase activator NlpD
MYMKRLGPIAAAILIGIGLVLIFGYNHTSNPTNPAQVSTSSTTQVVATSTNQTLTTESGPSMSIEPATVEQGDPALIVVNGLSASSISKLTFNGDQVPLFSYGNNVAGLVPIDLKMKVGTYPVVLTYANGQTLRKNLVVHARAVPEEELGIPDSLGGNTPEGESNLVSSLGADNAVLDSLPSASTALWSGKFEYPVADPVITDTYGFTRLTGDLTISHKGTDFHAPPGTPVYAMNSGKVVLTRDFTSYGNTIVIDHGLGLQTLYLHLSEIDVKEGDMVTKGELIGKSGETGYAEGPHLHLSVKINSISIDPMTFMSLF